MARPAKLRAAGSPKARVARRISWLIADTYGSPFVPRAQPESVTLSWNGFVDANCSRSDRFITNQAYTLTSVSHLLHPVVAPRNIIVGVFGGHANASYDLVQYGYLAFTQAALAAGYHVLSVDMPVCGKNPAVADVVIQGVHRALVDHPTIFLYCAPAPESYKCLRLFQEGYHRAINAALAVLPTARVAAMGHSGGAFQGAIAAAMDPRIERFFGCGGTLPYSIMARDDNWYDDEDKPGTRPWLEAAGLTYEDVFAAASSGTSSTGRQRECWYLENDNDNNWGLVSVPGRQALWSGVSTQAIPSRYGNSSRAKFTSIVYQGTPVTHDITAAMRTQILARLGAM